MDHHKFSLHGKHIYLMIAVYFQISTRFFEIEYIPVAEQIKFALDNTLKMVFGALGSSVSEFDILSFEESTAKSNEPSTVLLRVQRSGLKSLRSAVTMCTSLNGKNCKLEVLQIGDSLMDVASKRFL
ncbi:uncharacterized protein CCR75_005145 [Bremia lactucae]|uniref:Uncharacterized protein n=1 Tax=Bremia lactucae TaxID=4779 RepID=A0A976FP43_BRELC|nr:hypothetical protein CCR75_005145 [Bremia lactucae]